MNPYLRAQRWSKHGVGPGPGDPGGNTLTGTMKLGMNLEQHFYFNANPIFVNLFRNGGGVFNAAGSAFAALSSDGHPAEDCLWSFGCLMPDDPINQDVTCIVDGDAGTVTLQTANFWSVSSSSYNSSTNKTTIIFHGPSSSSNGMLGPIVKFVGTRKQNSGTGSTPGSGVGLINVIRPGYESTPNQKITNEFIASAAPFSTLRYVKMTRGEIQKGWADWAATPRRGTATRSWSSGQEDDGYYAIEDIVDIANATGTDIWLNIQGDTSPNLTTTSQEYGYATYIEANLNSDLHCYYELANETWNYFAYFWMDYGINQAMPEINGFWNDTLNSDGVSFRGTRRINSATRSGGTTVTCVWNVPHGLTTGNVYALYLPGTGNVTAAVTVIDSVTMSFASAGANGALSVSAGGGWNTNSSSLLIYDQQGYPAQILAERWFVRRKLKMSQNIHLAVGDAKFLTRHRPVDCSQMAGGTIYRYRNNFDMLVILGTDYKTNFYAMCGGAYPDGTVLDGTRISQDVTNPHTKAEYLAEYQDSAKYSHVAPNLGFAWDAFKFFALQHGIRYFAYEAGQDTKNYTYLGNTYPHWSDNAQHMRDATVDAGWKDVENYALHLQCQYGCDLAIQFNYGMENISNNNFQGYWGMWWDDTVVGPKQQAYLDFHATPPSITRNVVPGTVDARAMVQHYGAAFDGDITADSYPTFATLSNFDVDQSDRFKYLITGSATGPCSLKINYKTINAVTHTGVVYLNGVSQGTVTFTSAGAGVSAQTAPITINILEGPFNALEILRDTSPGTPDFEPHQLVITAL